MCSSVAGSLALTISLALVACAGSAATTVLDPKQEQSLQVGAAEFAGAEKVSVSVALQDGAQNNYSCGVLIEPSV